MICSCWKLVLFKYLNFCRLNISLFQADLLHLDVDHFLDNNAEPDASNRKLSICVPFLVFEYLFMHSG